MVAQLGFEPKSRDYEPRVNPNFTTAQYATKVSNPVPRGKSPMHHLNACGAQPSGYPEGLFGMRILPHITGFCWIIVSQLIHRVPTVPVEPSHLG
jgi:hypothetical protein